jgi:hypothetical protein
MLASRFRPARAGEGPPQRQLAAPEQRPQPHLARDSDGFLEGDTRRLGRGLGRPQLAQDPQRLRLQPALAMGAYRYIFPGDHTPVVLPELLAAANRTALEPITLHNDRHSCFLTLQAWARNLEAAHGELAARFGERVYRLFRIYLWAGAPLHRDGGLESYRVLFQKSRDLPSAEIGFSGSP